MVGAGLFFILWTFSYSNSNLQQFGIQNASEEWKSADFFRTLQQFGIQNAWEEWKFCRGIPAPGCIFRPARSKSTTNLLVTIPRS
jgi:hypothetical protein